MEFDGWLTAILFGAVALLYASVGHAGASGYLAVMSWMDFGPEKIRPISWILNIVVATIASVSYISRGQFESRTFLIFSTSAVPMAYVGATIQLSPVFFKLLAGILLLTSAALLMLRTYKQTQEPVSREMNWMAGLIFGAFIGLLSGLVGVGGGVFLTPLLLLNGWADAKRTAGISALFILVNSLAGMVGNSANPFQFGPELWLWVAAVGLGGWVGASLGSKLANRKLRIALIVLVLFSAGLKFLLTA